MNTENRIKLRGKVENIEAVGNRVRFDLGTKHHKSPKLTYHNCWFFVEWMGMTAHEFATRVHTSDSENFVFEGELRYNTYSDGDGVDRTLPHVFIRTILIDL